ncbi:hypothetical protein GCM10009765_07340 [Fodinicola feengrottensis]|uniref:Hydrolytic protein n=1 Tax=Fodinicola feengrottensis TaxID=435914 RepID=A0ABN2FVE8_9ACTN
MPFVSTHATLDAPTLDIEPGATASCGVTIRNSSPIIEQYRFEVVGPAAGWATIEPAVVNIYPDNDAEVSVTFSPPRSSRVPAGEVPYAVRVLPAENPAAATAVEGLVRIRPFFQTTAEISPRTSRGRRRARHEVAVDNTGNVPVHVELSGGDPDGQLTVRPRPSMLTVQPGQALFSAIDVRARRAYWRGQPITRPFQVMVSPGDGAPIVLDANMLQVAILPRNILKWVAAILALIILAAAAWFLLAKPAIDSAAQKAAEDAAGQSAAAVQAAQSAAAAANRRLDKAGIPPDGAAPAPSATPSGKAPVVANASTQLAAHANNGQQSAVTTDPRDLATLVPVKGGVYTVPQIDITNPQKDTGTIEILVDGVPKWTQALDNLFELPFKFDPALVLTTAKAGGQDGTKPHVLAIRINCTKAGDPIPLNGKVQGGGTCREYGSVTYTSVTPPATN